MRTYRLQHVITDARRGKDEIIVVRDEGETSIVTHQAGTPPRRLLWFVDLREA